MTQTEMWEGFETGQGPFFRLLRIVLIAAGMVVLFFFGSLALSWPQQAVLGLLILLLCIWLSRVSDSYLITLTLMMLSMFATFRYGWWRVSSDYRVLPGSGNEVGPGGCVFYPAAAGRGGLRVCDSVYGIPADGVAAAAGAGGAARRSGGLAGSRPADSDL